jgi:hypothetical protein
MKHFNAFNVSAFLVLAIATLLPACASISPVKSKPPYSKIVVNRPFSWGDGVITIKVNMPAGAYLPTFEDKGGYYYQAPQKITGRDTFFPLLVDGGLYLDRKRTKPDAIYIIRNQYGIPVKVDIGERADVTMVK